MTPITPEDFDRLWRPDPSGQPMFWLDMEHPADIRAVVEALTGFAFVAASKVPGFDVEALEEAVYVAFESVRAAEQAPANVRVELACEAVDAVLRVGH